MLQPIGLLNYISKIATIQEKMNGVEWNRTVLTERDWF
jgi:hypothetical protein